MIFKCNNCGSVMTYSPEHNAMYCEHCDSLESQGVVTAENMSSCVNCGAPIEVGPVTSASKCEHCGCYMVFEERISGEYTPHMVIPFKIGKEQAKGAIKAHVGKNIFVPNSFLKESYLDKVEGIYVPFWMYDYDANYDYHGIGKIIRSWTSGNTEYTETSIYDVHRNMDIDFDLIPVDASAKMVDKTMDLMEPYNYSALEVFQAKYMSGFNGEIYNFSADELELRAREKAQKYSDMLMTETLAGYTINEPTSKNLTLNPAARNYALLPVWRYTYFYRDKNYEFYINGQTGKMVGDVPTSKKLKFGYFGIAFALFTLGLYLLWYLLEVL